MGLGSNQYLPILALSQLTAAAARLLAGHATADGSNTGYELVIVTTPGERLLCAMHSLGRELYGPAPNAHTPPAPGGAQKLQAAVEARQDYWNDVSRIKRQLRVDEDAQT